MSSLLETVEVLLGIAILYWGAEWLVRGSAQVARAFGVKPLVVGLTVVAYGNSAPELAVATKTALTHHQPIALGVVIGSCAANISLILGITALVSPPTIDRRIMRREIPVLLGSVLVLPLLLWNGVLSELEGGILLGCAILFTVVTLTISARIEPDEAYEPEARRATTSAEHLAGKGHPSASRGKALLMTILGLGILVLGSDLFVAGARALGQQLGISERMLGLTVIALGTALPELIGSIVAASRGQASLAIGAVVSSNLLNVFLVLGVVALLRPIHLGERVHAADALGLVAITLLAIIALRGNRRISRIEGALLVAAYIAFVTFAAIF